MNEDANTPPDNRAKKVEGRAKRRRFVQGTRAYTHAITNSIARRAAAKKREDDAEHPRDDTQSRQA